MFHPIQNDLCVTHIFFHLYLKCISYFIFRLILKLKRVIIFQIQVKIKQIELTFRSIWKYCEMTLFHLKEHPVQQKQQSYTSYTDVLNRK